MATRPILINELREISSGNPSFEEGGSLLTFTKRKVDLTATDLQEIYAKTVKLLGKAYLLQICVYLN